MQFAPIKKSRDRDVDNQATTAFFKENIQFKLCFRHLHTQMCIGIANNCWVITLNSTGPHQLASEG